MNQFVAAGVGNLQQMRVALTVENVNDVDDNGWTALHYAVYHRASADSITYCIDTGANVNARNRHEYTPLHYASFFGDVIVVCTLLDAGAIIDAPTIDGWTPLHCSIQRNHVAVARLLVDRGARLSNVILNVKVPAIPDWLTTFIESRSNCRTAAIIIVGIRKFHRKNVPGNNDVNVLRLIGKHIWSTRMDYSEIN
jgi:ankyrin repeat protein